MTTRVAFCVLHECYQNIDKQKHGMLYEYVNFFRLQHLNRYIKHTSAFMMMSREYISLFLIIIKTLKVCESTYVPTYLRVHMYMRMHVFSCIQVVTKIHTLVVQQSIPPQTADAAPTPTRAIPKMVLTSVMLVYKTRYRLHRRSFLNNVDQFL